MGAQKTASKSKVSFTDEQANFRHRFQRETLKSLGVRDDVSTANDWKRAASAMPILEGNYSGSKNYFQKNEYMKMLEGMVPGMGPSRETLQSNLLGNAKIDAPAASGKKSPEQVRFENDLLAIIATEENLELRKWAAQELAKSWVGPGGIDKAERIQAALALRNIVLDFPEFADSKFPQFHWVHEKLLILATDENPEVRKWAKIALNKNISDSQLNQEMAKKLKD